MVFRTFLAGACAVAIGAATAGPAIADSAAAGQANVERAPAAALDYQQYYPAAIQIWSPAGYLGRIRCTTPAVHPACDPAQGRKPIDDLVREYGGYRLLARTGRWFELGATEATYEAMELADTTGGRGAADMVRSEDELDPYDPRA